MTVPSTAERDARATSSARAALAEARRAAVQRRTLRVAVASQLFSGAGLAAGVTTGALLAQQLFGATSLAGVPAALFTLGAAGAAMLVGRLSQRWGRRVGLVTGYLVGAVGAAGVVLGAVVESVPLFLLALLLYGAGTATNLQARYAGGDLALPTRRATSMSVIMVAATLGAVAGPSLAQPMATVAERFDVPGLAGVFMLAAAAYALAALMLHVFLRPDPFLVARQQAIDDPSAPALDQQESHVPGLLAGATVMVTIQMVMVGIMTMTPVHMRENGHDLAAIGLVIGAHIGAMYLPSLVTGVLVDRLGRTVMAAAAGVTLVAAAAVASLAPAHSTATLVAALALLGLGWNFGLLSGTAMIVDAAAPARRARIQGSIDLLVALAGATGAAGGGVVHASAGYTGLALLGGTISLTIIATAWVGHRRSRPRS